MKALGLLAGGLFVGGLYLLLFSVLVYLAWNCLAGAFEFMPVLTYIQTIALSFLFHFFVKNLFTVKFN